MKINLNFDYDKLSLKEIVILIPKHHPNMVSFLTPILGLYGINVKEFINDFETKTRFISFDIIIPVKVRITKIKTFEMFLKTPYITSILSNLPNFSLNNPNLTVLVFYKISLLKSIFFFNLLKNYQKRIYISLRKYVSLISKNLFSLSVKKTVLDIFLEKGYASFKSTVLNSVFLRKVLFARYGVFIAFSNQKGNLDIYLKKSLSLVHMHSLKIKSRFLSSIVGQDYFYTNNFFYFSQNFNHFVNFFRDLPTPKASSNFFIMYYKFGVNLIVPSFFRSFFVFFSKFGNYLSMIKVLKIVLLRFLNNINYLKTRLIYLLKYNADLPSNII